MEISIKKWECQFSPLSILSLSIRILVSVWLWGFHLEDSKSWYFVFCLLVKFCFIMETRIWDKFWSLKNYHVHDTPQRILNKFIEINFSVGCINCPWAVMLKDVKNSLSSQKDRAKSLYWNCLTECTQDNHTLVSLNSQWTPLRTHTSSTKIFSENFDLCNVFFEKKSTSWGVKDF